MNYCVPGVDCPPIRVDVLKKYTREFLPQLLLLVVFWNPLVESTHNEPLVRSFGRWRWRVRGGTLGPLEVRPRRDTFSEHGTLKVRNWIRSVTHLCQYIDKSPFWSHPYGQLTVRREGHYLILMILINKKPLVEHSRYHITFREKFPRVLITYHYIERYICLHSKNLYHLISCGTGFPIKVRLYQPLCKVLINFVCVLRRSDQLIVTLCLLFPI